MPPAPARFANCGQTLTHVKIGRGHSAPTVVYRTFVSSIKSEEYEAIYSGFEAAISRYDCGQYCSPHNGGEPVCCSTKNAIPVATVEEWKFLKSRSDLWHIYQPNTKAERKIKDELAHDCRVL